MFGFIKKIIKQSHEHETFTPPVQGFYWADWNVDDVVGFLLRDRIALIDGISCLRIEVNQVKADLAAIHAHYRSELCNDCCHSEVCKLRPSVKYGFDCEDKGYDVEITVFEVEPEKVEGEKEETNANHI